MNYNDNGTIKQITVKAGDTLPVGTEVDVPDGTTIPAGWEEVDINLFSGATIVSGYGFNNNGELYQASTRSYFDYIEVEAYQTYIMENISPAVTCFYDSNKSFISSTTGSTYSTPANTFYVRTAFVNTDPYTNATLKKRNYGGTKRIRKTYNGVVPNGKLLNSYSTSQNDGYSCDYINDLTTYSTDEVVVGTWVDGKPLYRKVLVDTVPTITSSGTLQVKDINMPSNADATTLRVKEAHLLNSGRLIPALFYLNDTLNYFIKVYSSGNFKIRIASNNASYSENAIYIIVEYTKTTD